MAVSSMAVMDDDGCDDGESVMIWDLGSLMSLDR